MQNSRYADILVACKTRLVCIGPQLGSSLQIDFRVIISRLPIELTIERDGMADAWRVGVVDDSIVACKLVERILRSCGFEHIKLAQDGKTALEYVGKADFDFIICDWEMQPMSGIDALNEVRRDTQAKKTLFILMSAKKAPHWLLAAKKAGADAVIPKPFDADMLNMLKEKIAQAVGETKRGSSRLPSLGLGGP